MTAALSRRHLATFSSMLASASVVLVISCGAPVSLCRLRAREPLEQPLVAITEAPLRAGVVADLPLRTFNGIIKMFHGEFRGGKDVFTIEKPTRRRI